MNNQTEPTSGVPNTNKHSVEGSNPIWLKGYENEWFKNDENSRLADNKYGLGNIPYT